jgi:SPP1 gp7 family putative phage head morphogenesis protein
VAVKEISGGQLWRGFNSAAIVDGLKLREMEERIKNVVVSSVQQQIREGWEAGETTKQIADRIRPPPTVDGKGDSIASRAWRELDQVTDAALQGMLVEAQELLVKVNRGIVGRYIFLALLDSRTCPKCAVLHGRVFRIDRNRLSLRTDRLFDVPTPPIHWGCRCSISFARTGEPLPKVQSFDEWLRDQDEETVADVLGKTRARLFLDGDLEVRDFVRGDEVLTLRELRKRNLAAFEQAGIENLRAS